MLPTRDYLRAAFGLTRRQADVAILIGIGKSNAAIAAELFISPHTVRHHTEQILMKMNAASRAQVAAQLHSRNSVAGARTDSRKAHDLYLRGRFELHRRGSFLRAAIRYFELSIEEDPLFAAAHGALALALAVAHQHGIVLDDDVPERVRAAASRGLSLDPLLADSFAAIGFIQEDLVLSERDLRRAVELDPTHATAYNRLAQTLAQLGRLDEALEYADRAVEMDPVSAIHRAVRGRILFWARRYEEAGEELLEALRMNPELRLARHWLVRVFEANGEVERALEIATAQTTRRWNATLEEEAALILGARSPRSREKALEVLHRLHSEARWLGYELAATAAYLGEHELALEWLEAVYFEVGASTAARLDPRLDPLRDDPRFARAVTRLCPLPAS
jgi:DNA-binding CsgD family transcriptional regulator